MRHRALICGASARELILTVNQLRVFTFTGLRAAQEGGIDRFVEVGLSAKRYAASGRTEFAANLCRLWASVVVSDLRA